MSSGYLGSHDWNWRRTPSSSPITNYPGSSLSSPLHNQPRPHASLHPRGETRPALSSHDISEEVLVPTAVRERLHNKCWVLKVQTNNLFVGWNKQNSRKRNFRSFNFGRLVCERERDRWLHILLFPHIIIVWFSSLDCKILGKSYLSNVSNMLRKHILFPNVRNKIFAQYDAGSWNNFVHARHIW